MYSFRITKDGKQEVVIHQMPFDRNNPFGMKKLARYLDMGYTFEDPRVLGLTGKPIELAVTETEDAPLPVGSVEEAPLYVSDKPEKKKKAKRGSRKNRS